MHAPRPDRAERERINSDEEERRRFVLDVEKGTWSNQGNLLDPDDDSPVGPRHERVIPYVEDHRNCLILEPTLERLHLGLESLAAGHPHYAHKDVAELRTMLMASLQAALKSAIQVRYQLEESEIAVEPLPGRDDRRLLLSYEAAEGGAGVLRRLVEEPEALPAVARAEHLASLLRLAGSELERRWLAHALRPGGDPGRGGRAGACGRPAGGGAWGWMSSGSWSRRLGRTGRWWQRAASSSAAGHSPLANPR